MSPFQSSIDYQPLLFASQEPDAAVPSAQTKRCRCHLVKRCRCTWERARKVLIQAGRHAKVAADRRRTPAPKYVCEQRVWLSTKNLPLKVPAHKLAPRFIGPYHITKFLSTVAVRLRLPSIFARVHPFHVSHVKPIISFPLNPGVSPVSLKVPQCFLLGGCWTPEGVAGDTSTLWTGKGTVLRRGAGCRL